MLAMIAMFGFAFYGAMLCFGETTGVNMKKPFSKIIAQGNEHLGNKFLSARIFLTYHCIPLQ